MNYINELTNIKYLCRICLTQSKNIIPLNTSLENIQNSPLILEVLEAVVNTRVISIFFIYLCPSDSNTFVDNL